MTGGSISGSPSVIRLSKLVYLHKSPNLDIFICNFCFKPSPFTKLSVKCQTWPRLLIFHSTTSLFHKKFLFRKFLKTSLHVIFGLPLPPIKNPGYAYARGMAFRTVSLQITACAPQARVNFCSSTTSKLFPKNRYHKRFFL